MTRTVILTAAFAAWAAGAAAQTTGGTSVSFLPRAAFHMGAERLGGSDDERFRWDANLGGELDFVDYTHGRLTFVANYQAILGEEKQVFDPNQGNYILEVALSARITPMEAALVFYHQSRHLSDRAKDEPVDWNMVGGRVQRAFLVGTTYVDSRADLRWTVQRSFVDYEWELDTHVRADWLLRPGLGVLASGGVRYVGVDGSANRDGQAGYRTEGGFRFEGGGGAVELFVAAERRIDPYPLEFGTATWVTAGFRLLSR